MKLKYLILVLVVLKIDIFVFADEKPKFPHEIYYIEPHPKAKFNVLKNGLRYILLPNPNHNGKVLISLYVYAGAIHEKEGQQGVAHFVEHMAFNGTKNHPSESLTTFLSNMGMSLSEDANAKTGLYHTEYFFSLQDSINLYEGLSILSDFAMNIIFDKTEIEKEKGVILSEKRFRNTVLERISNRYYQFVLPNISFAQNKIIGDEAAILATSQELCFDYYKNNYRPNNMVLVVVGDINFNRCEKLIAEKFNGFSDKSSSVSPPLLIDVKHKGIKVNYNYEEGMPYVNIKIGTAQKLTPPEKSFFEISKAELAEIAFKYIIQKRLVGNFLQKDCPLNSFNIKIENICDQIHLSTFEANCEASQWEAALNLLISELNKVISSGFLDSELESFKDWYHNSLKTELDEKSTLQNENLMSQILHSLKENKPFVNTKQSYKYSKVLLEILSKEMVHKEFKKYWECDHRLISVSGNVLIKEPEVEIKKLYDSAIIIKEDAVKKGLPVKFPYIAKPKEPWTITKSQEVSNRFFSRYFYKNNLILNFKYSNFKANQVLFKINLGLGDIALPEGKEALSRIASHVINFGGLEKISFFELKSFLNDKNVNVYFYVGANCFTIECESSTKDFELALQVCRAMLLNPGFRPEAEEVLNKTIHQKYAILKTDILAHFNNSLNGIIAKGSPILFWPDRKVISAVNLNDAKVWLQEQLKDCAIEMNVVGDKGYLEVRELVGLYFGSLPKRNTIQPRKLRDLELKTNFNIEEKFPSKINKSLIAWIFPTVDYRQIKEVHKLDLLQVILQEKINKLVREKLSLSYTPEVEHVVKDDYKNNCYLKFFADTNTEGVASVQKAFEDTIKDLLEVGVTKEELDNAKKVAVNHTRSFVSSKQFLFDIVLAFSAVEPENIVLMQSYYKCYEYISLSEIQESIKTYLNLEKKSVYILRGSQD